jgi:hypothetical protein
MLISKLNAKKYPCLPIDEALKYLNPIGSCDLKGVDIVFLGRLGALCKFMLKKADLNSGKRNHNKQIELFIGAGGHKNADGTYEGGSGKVAKPGTSRHEFGLAVDTASLWLKELDKVEASKLQKTLNKFGLHKPLTKGNKKTLLEDWHIEPIETYGVRYTAEAMSKIAPTEVKNGH